MAELYFADSKEVSEVLDYDINWSTWLDGDTISTSTWAVPTGITQDSESETTTVATIWVSGGTAGNVYKLVNTIVTAGGRTATAILDLAVAADSGIRSGMRDLIERLRQMTQAGTADYTLAGETYWTAPQLQDYLDRNVLLLNFAQMRSEPEWNDGSLEYRDYYTPRNLGNLETTDSGTQYFSIEDSAGNEASLSDFEIADYNAGWFRRSADTEGTQYQIKARSYNLNAAAAEIWEAKAASVWEMVDIKSDGEAISLSQMQDHAMKQARYYRKQGGAKLTSNPEVK